MKLDFLNDYEFFTGVPDSLLAPLCSYLMDRYGIDGMHHIIAANEGNSVALAAGYHLSTGKVPVVYLQNSGIGNIINPVASLLNDKVYGIPCIFFVGWRGEPGVHDEPQHVFQGEITVKLLEDMDISVFVVGKDTADSDIAAKIEEWQPLLAAGKQVAFVIKKGAIQYSGNTEYKNDYPLRREEIIREIVKVSGNDLIVSTTGKASRELFEIREANEQSHSRDFLTVGSMGHCSSIALELALQHPKKRVWCIDGDGAALMHMGAMAVIGAQRPKNLIHVVINNGAHESVGGMPTVADNIDFVSIAKACGYKKATVIASIDELKTALKDVISAKSMCFMEIKCTIGARENLGRPTTTAAENKSVFMNETINKK